MEIISESTTISIGLLIAVSGAVIGGAVWLASMRATIGKHAEKLESMESEMKRVDSDLRDIQQVHARNGERLASIETKLETIEAMLKTAFNKLFDK